MDSRLRGPNRDEIRHIHIGKSFHLVWLCAAALCLLTGCWDRLEIEQRAMVLGLALDEASPQEVRRLGISTHLNRPPQSTNIFPLRLTAQIAVPGRIPLGPGSDPGGGSGSASGNEGGE
ncbi:MAG: hypothetical protein IRY98_08245, partial [Alicyclobacillaceae bacterium]|nr:hypothetical protein [Alicyclobacillaceae bacterium]